VRNGVLLTHRAVPATDLQLAASEVGAGRDGKYGELDAVELASLVRLVRELDFEDALLAWGDVRERIGETALTAAPKLIVFDLQAKTAVVVDDLAKVGPSVTSGRPFRVIEVGADIAQARATYRRLKEVHEAGRATNDGARIRRAVDEDQ